jgi:hypothetical protein
VGHGVVVDRSGNLGERLLLGLLRGVRPEFDDIHARFPDRSQWCSVSREMMVSESAQFSVKIDPWLRSER